MLQSAVPLGPGFRRVNLHGKGLNMMSLEKRKKFNRKKGIGINYVT